jgi:SAM-dependent methyltransferase
MGTSTDWGASFASAGVDAMTAYDEILVPRLFDDWTEVLLDEVRVAPGSDVLDVACGPGTVTRKAALRAGPSGSVTGCDFSPAMLEVAGRKGAVEGAAPITYRECPADALAVPDEAFDVAVCQQGLQFFPDRVAAVAEIRRALRPGARVGAAVWCAIEECPFWDALATAVGEVIGKEAEVTFRNGPWGLGDSEDLISLFDVADFRDIVVRRAVKPAVFEGGPAQLVATLAAANVGPQFVALDEAGRAALLAAAERNLAPFLRNGEVHSEAATHIVRATR